MEYDVLDITDERARELAQILANDKAVAILKSEKKHHLLNRFKVITLTLAVGISSLVYEIARRFSSANAHRPP